MTAPEASTGDRATAEGPEETQESTERPEVLKFRVLARTPHNFSFISLQLRGEG